MKMVKFIMFTAVIILLTLIASAPRVQAYDKKDPVENYFRIQELQYLRNQDIRDRTRLKLQERNTRSLESFVRGSRTGFRPIRRSDNKKR